jgi:hypothetical protein
MSMEINKIWIDYKKTLKKSGKEETLDYFWDSNNKDKEKEIEIYKNNNKKIKRNKMKLIIKRKK